MEELYVEYLEDLIEESGGADQVVLNRGTRAEPDLFRPRGTSDLEAKIAAGKEFDIYEGMKPEDRAVLEKFIAGSAPKADPVETFSDDYAKEK